MTKKALMKIREKLMEIDSPDMFTDEAIKHCIDLCDAALWPDEKLPPHQHHSDTSAAAAEAVAPKFGRMTQSVLTTLARFPLGLTDEEAQRIMGMEGNSYRPCRITLRRKGFVKDSEIRRKTAHKREAVVWAVTERGLNHLGGATTG